MEEAVAETRRTLRIQFEGLPWLRFQASNARGGGSIPGQGMKIPHATQRGQKKKMQFRSDHSEEGREERRVGHGES